jgi:Uncharacterized protein conserved in bacteria (DUF2252)
VTAVGGFDVVGFTAGYEDWLAERIPLVPADLAAKHAEMTASVLRFLRGTYYLWLRRVADLLPWLLDRPAVPLVGDLHVENFGSWRDRDGVRRWGVNDLDELARGGYALDLVRLATSAALVPGLALSTRTLCALLLEQWHTATPAAATPLDVEAAGHLRALVPDPQPSHRYYPALCGRAAADPSSLPPRVRAAIAGTVADGWRPTWHTRRAGTGSLGHPRMVAVGRDPTGEWQAREAKLLGPPTADWLRAGDPARPWPHGHGQLYRSVTAALRGPYPADRVAGWQLRRLAPDVQRIELPGLVAHDVERVVRSMAQSIVDVHGTEPAALAAARTDSEALPGDWLEDAVDEIVADTRACHHRWSRRPTAGQ